jgi:hypothetical protein
VSGEPLAVTDAQARAVAIDFGLGKYWRVLKAEMVARGAWINEEQKTTRT